MRNTRVFLQKKNLETPKYTLYTNFSFFFCAEIMLDILGLVVLASILYYVFVKIQRRNWPPGPFPYPIIGNALEIFLADPEGRPTYAFMELAKKYGNIFMIKAGVVNNVVIIGHKELKQAYAMEGILDRFDDEWLLDRAYGNDRYGLFFSTTNAWKNNRRFAVRTLKDFGFGRQKSMDDLILEEMQVLVKNIKDTTTKANGMLHVELTFNPAFVNIIYSFLTGERFKQDDPELIRLVNLANEFFSSGNIGGGALGAFPFLKNWAPELCGFAKNHQSNLQMLDYFTKLIQRYREEGIYKTSPRNFIEVALQRIDEGPTHEDYDEPIFTDRNLICLVNDLFSAGSETSANSTSFAVRRLIQNPEVQAKLQAEVDHVVGRDRWVTLTDKPKLRYVEAFTLEVLRCDTIAPISPRKCYTKCKFGEYEIPVGYHVLTVNHSGNMDKSVWGDPENFRPERFLSDDGKDIINAEKIMTFAFGKRDCIGQPVAKNTLFMAVASFVQHFTFSEDPLSGPPGYKCTNTLTIAPVPYNCLVKIR